MQVKLVNTKGEMMLLPEEMAVGGWPSEMELPGTKIQGRHGRIIDMSMSSLQPRTIRVSGTMAGIDRDDADAIREMIAGFVYRANPLKLYRHEDTDRYMLVYTKSVDHSYKTGYFGGKIFTLSITFEAVDPFFFSDLQQVTYTVTSSPAAWSVYQPGTVEKQQPIVYIKAVGQLVKPNLTNAEGLTVAFNDTIPQGKALLWNSVTREAYITDGNLTYYLRRWGLTQETGQPPTAETNVINEMNDIWLFYGWPLLPKANTVQYIDDPSSTHQAEITIAWQPRYY